MCVVWQPMFLMMMFAKSQTSQLEDKHHVIYISYNYIVVIIPLKLHVFPLDVIIVHTMRGPNLC